jgi:hypothetical protein
MGTIVSFDDLKNMLSLEKDSWVDYPDLQLIADQVHAALENFTGRTLSLVSAVTETGYFVSLDKYINLSNIPIVSVNEVLISESGYIDFEITPYGITLKIPGRGAWSVTSLGGFDVIPEDVYRAEMSQIIYEYQNINNLGTTANDNDGGGVTTPGFVLLTQVKNLLFPYKHVRKFGY